MLILNPKGYIELVFNQYLCVHMKSTFSSIDFHIYLGKIYQVCQVYEQVIYIHNSVNYCSVFGTSTDERDFTKLLQSNIRNGVMLFRIKGCYWTNASYNSYEMEKRLNSTSPPASLMHYVPF